MGFGAFLGGAVKGYQTMKDIQNTDQRTKIAQDDAALRKQAGDREQTRYKREEDAATRADKLRDEMAANVDKVFGPKQEATPETTETMTGPLDARDAQAGTMDGVQTTVTTPAQPAKGGMGGIDLMDPANHGKLLQLESLNMASQIRTGNMKPEQVRAYTEYGRKMEKEGTADAFRKFMTGDTSALDELAKKNGVKSYTTAFENHGGYPQMVFRMEKEDGTIQTVPASIIATGLGAADMAATMNQEGDNLTKGYQVKATADYHKDALQVQKDRVAIEDRRADQSAKMDDRRIGVLERNADTAAERVAAFDRRTAARAAGKGGADGYDPNLIPGLVNKTPPMLPQIGKPPLGVGAQKPQKDQEAVNQIASIGNDYYSRGTDPVEAERIGRTTVERAGQAAMKQLGPKATTEEFVRLRGELINQAREQLAKQKAAPADSPASLKPISPATQKARDSDKVGVLRQEREAKAAKLAAVKADPKATPEDVHREEADLDAIDRELGTANKQVSAFRTR